MRIIVALLGLFLLAGMPASAQAPEPPAQVRELLKLLVEPAVRSWLDAELKKAPPNAQGAASSTSSVLALPLVLREGTVTPSSTSNQRTVPFS